MSDTELHPPVLHGTYFERGSGCSYTGPDDDEPCHAEPVMHVCAGDEPDLLPSSLPACLDHLFHAVRAARTRRYWTAHPYSEGCAIEGANVIVTGGCKTVEPPTRCGLCGHLDDEHGASGCAADDEAAMGGCDCTAVVI